MNKIWIKKVSITTYLFCLIAFNTSAQESFTALQSKAYDHILSLNFAEADDLLKNANSSIDLYLKHFRLTVDFLLTEDPEISTFLDENQDSYLSQIKDGPDDEWKNFILAEVKLRSAFIDVKLGNELSATWQLRQAYKLIKENIEQYPDFIPSYKTLGLLHVLIGSVPDQYNWIIRLLGMEGDINDGLKELQKVSRFDNLFSLEAQVLEAIINTYLLGKGHASVNQMADLMERNKEKRLLTYITMAVLLKTANAQKGIELYQPFTNDYSNPLLHYISGELYLQLGEYQLAQKTLKAFLEAFKGKNFIKDTYYKLYLATWLQGKITEAQTYHQKALETGQTLSEADKHAEKMLRKSKGLNPVIMKIRLFTDGGAYDKANELIRSTDTTSLTESDHLEFIYRQARLLHKTDQLQEAKRKYQHVISRQNSRDYFAPNSCLQLGYIYQKEGNTALARKWFEKTLTYSNHEYKQSIDNKAKAALKHL